MAVITPPAQADTLSTLQSDCRTLHVGLRVMRLDRDRLLVATRHQVQIGGECRSLGHDLKAGALLCVPKTLSTLMRWQNRLSWRESNGWSFRNRQVKRTWLLYRGMSANDPKRTLCS